MNIRINAKATLRSGTLGSSEERSRSAKHGSREEAYPVAELGRIWKGKAFSIASSEWT